jgi:hypothetical protein
MLLTLVSPSLSSVELVSFSMKPPTVRAAYLSYKFPTVRVGFQVLAVVISSTVFWDIAPCNPLKLRALIATYFHNSFLLRLFFDSENRGDMFLRNVG